MPRSAAATGCVDFVLPPEKIAEEISRIISHPNAIKDRAAANAKQRRLSGPEESMASRIGKRHVERMNWPMPPADANLRKIFLMLRTKTGTDFTFYKSSTVRRRLARRLSANTIKSLEGYARFLQERPEEVEALYEDLLIHV